MFGTIGKALTKILGGTKHERDVKGLGPLVEEINNIGEQLRQISNDELRNKTLEFRAYIAQQLSAIDEEIQGLHDDAAQEDHHRHHEEALLEACIGTGNVANDPRRDHIATRIGWAHLFSVDGANDANAPSSWGNAVYGC